MHLGNVLSVTGTDLSSFIAPQPCCAALTNQTHTPCCSCLLLCAAAALPALQILILGAVEVWRFNGSGGGFEGPYDTLYPGWDPLGVTEDPDTFAELKVGPTLAVETLRVKAQEARL